MKPSMYETIIVGSGAGGAALAKELVRRGKQVLLLERGRYEPKVGNLKAALGYYDVNRWTQTPVTSKEGVMLWRALMAGGSTVVSCGNATRCLENELGELGIDILLYLDEIEGELNPGITPNTLVSAGGRAVAQAAAELGCPMQAMPKFIDAARCRGCGQCVLGCPFGAKWTSRQDLDAAVQNGLEVMTGVQVHKVLATGGRVVGVHASGPQGEQDLYAPNVVLAAGGLGTPIILQRSGIPAGGGLFLDLFVNTYGVTEDLNLQDEPTMSLVNLDFHASEGFLLSPFVNHTRLGRTIELGPRGALLPDNRLLGIMCKITDEPAGRVYPDGTFSKPVTPRDQLRLQRGSDLARQILIRAGAQPGSVIVSRPQGAHPGGTAAIGQVVDRDLQTSVNNLFVCDASVLPAAPGLPPILTILALARRLADTLAPAAAPVSRPVRLPVPAYA